MNIVILSTLVAVGLIGTVSAQVSEIGKPLLFTFERINELRKQPEKWSALKAKADEELSLKPAPVKDFTPGQHFSSTGAIKHDDEQERFDRDTSIAYNEALCYALTRDLRYAKQAQTFIDAWASTVQSVGKNQGASDFSYRIPLFIIAASLVQKANDWDDSTFRKFLDKKVRMNSRSSRDNNWGNWGVLLDTCIAFYLHDTELQAKAEKRWQELMKNQVAADGSLPLEVTRSGTSNWNGGPDKGFTGLSHTHMALLATVATAEVFLSQGIDLYHTTGGKQLRKAFNRAASWTLHPETFPYYKSNKGKLKGIDNGGYFAVLIKHYDNADARILLSKGSLNRDFFWFLVLDKD